jgi:hypothetical protein
LNFFSNRVHGKESIEWLNLNGYWTRTKSNVVIPAC